MSHVNLALFDLDNTLLAGDSDFAWAQYLISRGALDREVYEAQNEQFFTEYKAGTLDIHAFLDFQLAPLSRHPRRVLDAWHQDFMQKRILPLITPEARKMVEQHMANGDLCAIVTATNDFVTSPIAREFGIRNLIATVAQLHNGEFTGKPEGVPCFREGKITRVESWLAETGKSLAGGPGKNGFAKSWFYSDSLNDLPLLERVTDPVAVNPDPTLLATARERGWPVVNLHPANRHGT
jgi:HAD superfamily hydrolase (TIGR01490 family)